MYRLGATILPVWPTCQSAGTMPASVAARDAPIAAPSRSASSSSTPKFLPSRMPRPPDTTTLASLRSGRSDFWLSVRRYSAPRASIAPAAADITSPAAAAGSAASNELCRAVTHTGSPLISTVA